MSRPCMATRDAEILPPSKQDLATNMMSMNPPLSCCLPVGTHDGTAESPHIDPTTGWRWKSDA